MRRAPVVLVLAAVALAGLAALAGPGAETAARDGTPAADQALVGAWAITAQLEGGGPVAFVSVATIMPGGVLVNTAPDTPLGHGAWGRIGDRDYAITIVHPDFDGEGGLEGMVTVRATVALGPGGDTFSGPFVAEVADLAGNVLVAFGGTAAGRRIAVGLMPPGTPAAATPAA